MPTPPITRNDVKRVKELLKENKNHREISKLTGLAIGTVSKIRHMSDIIDIDEDTQKIEYVSAKVKTEEDAIRECQVDLTKWYVSSFECTAWTTPVKIKNGKDVADTLELVQNFRVALKLKRIQGKAQQMAYDALFERMAKHAPLYKKVSRPKSQSKEKELAVFCLFDVHFGKLAWSYECGEDYDLKIAERLYSEAIDDLSDKASHRNIAKSVLLVGSDQYHIDNYRNQTTAGTPQDVDGRFAKIIETGEIATIRAIERLLQVSPVDVLWVPGNHDAQTSYHLARTISAWFRNCQDVKVDCSPTMRKYYRWGTNLIGFTHGNEEKHEALPMLMANERPSDFADTSCREWLIGHQHQSKQWMTKNIDTKSGTVIRVVQSLCSSDGWHMKRGYISLNRAAECHFYGYDSGNAGWMPFNVKKVK